MKHCMLLTVVGGMVVPSTSAEDLQATMLDNFYLNAGGDIETPISEGSTGFGTSGANWGIPLAQPDNVALGLQLGGGENLRAYDPEWDGTIGAFGRNLASFGQQKGAAAVLFDYRQTLSQDDSWAVRPILGTTISAKDALGVEGVAPLNEQRGQKANNSLTTFWTRGWNERIGTEFGAGYEFRSVKGALLRARVAMALTPSTDFWWGGDANVNGSYAVGMGVTYYFGDKRRYASLHNIGGSTTDLYAPFPTSDYPALLSRKK